MDKLFTAHIHISRHPKNHNPKLAHIPHWVAKQHIVWAKDESQVVEKVRAFYDKKETSTVYFDIKTLDIEEAIS